MVPQKLSWVTIPLIVNIVLGALGLLLLPFLGVLMNTMLGVNPETAQDAQTAAFARMFTGATLWLSGLIGLAWLIFQFLTLRALQAGKAWARIAAIVIAVLSLLSFPIGTLLGIFMLIGAFDPDVQRYASR